MRSCSIAKLTSWPIPIVGRLGPSTDSTGRSRVARSPAAARISTSSSTEPITSAAAKGGVFLHTGSWLMPLERITSIASRTGCSGLTYNRSRGPPERSMASASVGPEGVVNPKLAIQSSLYTLDR